ncbi:DUF6221 family protein [Nocardia elegans]|uniref:DUF6221 family protein n=1 Tax=Nocardia elegans TaxID=300029 RepID=A0ABW6TLA0_9NOCA
MSDIVDFIEMRLREDEQIARAASGGHLPGADRWQVDGMQVWTELDCPPGRTLVVKHTWPHEADHIARHDPESVLREIESKRQALKAYADNSTREPDYWDAIDWWLRSIATVYSDHPDFQPEWAA